MKQRSLKLYLVLLPLLLLAAACTKKSVSIKGELANAQGKTLYLVEQSPVTAQTIDSVKIGSKGTFSFGYNAKTDEPVFVMLRTDSVIVVNLLVQKNEKIFVKADLAKPNDYTVEGSAGSDQILQLSQRFVPVAAQYDQMTRHIIPQPANNDEYEHNKQVYNQMYNLVNMYKINLIEFILQHPASYASVAALSQRFDNMPVFGQDQDINLYKLVIDSLSAHYPQSVYVKSLQNTYNNLNNRVNTANVLDNATPVDGLPDIELQNNTDRPVKLSSLTGKVILVDYWLPSDKAQLMANRELIDIYNTYHSKGFDVFQISEEQDKIAWKQAVADQQVPWTSVMDGANAYAARLYNVQKLPANYLLNDKRQVIGQNLYGKALDDKLKELLK